LSLDVVMLADWQNGHAVGDSRVSLS